MGHTVSKNGSISFYAGCPKGHTVSENGSISLNLLFQLQMISGSTSSLVQQQ